MGRFLHNSEFVTQHTHFENIGYIDKAFSKNQNKLFASALYLLQMMCVSSVVSQAISPVNVPVAEVVGEGEGEVRFEPCHEKTCLFSSPELLGSQGELIGWP